MNGKMALPLVRERFYEVYGGRYRARPKHMVGLKIAAEIDAPCDIDIPTRDFNVPPMHLMTLGLEQAIDAITAGQPLYAGCMGGIGRTGLFLAILAKAWGIEDPVAYVRANYLGHAVETEEQKQYVKDFVVPEFIQRKVKKAKLKAWFKAFWSRQKNLTNPQSDLFVAQANNEAPARR